MDKSVTVNDKQELFVISSGGGFSCFGFQKCFDESVELARVLGRADLMPTDEQLGKVEQYNGYRNLVALYAKFVSDSGSKMTWFGANVPEPVKDILETARKGGGMLMITYGDAETGRAWDDTPEKGRIGRSMGPMQVPLLLESAKSSGGEALLCSSIVRIQESKSKRDLYVHPTFHVADAPEQAVSAPAP